jgi:hypothetical protein
LSLRPTLGLIHEEEVAGEHDVKGHIPDKEYVPQINTSRGCKAGLSLCSLTLLVSEKTSLRKLVHIVLARCV